MARYLPARHPVTDEGGKATRPWTMFFQQLVADGALLMADERYVPAPHPVIDKDGKVTRPWALFFQQLAGDIAAGGGGSGGTGGGSGGTGGGTGGGGTWADSALVVEVASVFELVTVNGDQILVAQRV